MVFWWVAKGVATLFATPLLQMLGDVIERSTHDFQFRVLIVYRGLYVAMSHGSRHSGKVSGSHQNLHTIVRSRTVENQSFRKARFVARFSEEIA
jgi:hypothetical protein